MALPVTPGTWQTDFSSTGKDWHYVVDNNGRHFIIDASSTTRYELGGAGSRAAAAQLHGPPITGVYLTGYTEKKAIGDLYAPNEMEKILAGHVPVPQHLRGEIETTDSGYVANPITVTAGSGQVFQAQYQEDSGPAPTPAQEEAAQTDPTTDLVIPDNSDAKAYVTEVLRRYGLESLADDVWDGITGDATEAEIMQNLRQTEEYQTRFAGMAARDANNLNAISEEEYLQLERGYQQIMRAYGLPAKFYDSPEDYAEFIGQDVSVAELEERVVDGMIAARNAPVEVQRALKEFYGISSAEGALAAYYLDPDKSLDAIAQEFRAAQVAGAGKISGVFDGLDQQRAEELAAMGVDFGAALQGFGQIGQMEALFKESISEGTDLTAEGEGIDAFLAGNARARKAINKRLEQRRAAFSGQSAGAAITERGLSLGAAE